jgi:hypothetical protein
MGVFLSPNDSKMVIKTFENWWNDKAHFPRSGWLKNLKKSSATRGNEEPGQRRLPKLFPLPPAPPDAERRSPLFRDYKAFRTSYREFAETYVALGKRLFPKAPLFIETELFLNYLFHHGAKPSKRYEKKRGFAQPDQTGATNRG